MDSVLATSGGNEFQIWGAATLKAYYAMTSLVTGSVIEISHRCSQRMSPVVSFRSQVKSRFLE